MAVEKVPDPYDLIQGNFPEDSEEQFAASAASMSEMVLHHNLMASEYNSAIRGLGDENFQGLLATATREEFSNLAASHEAGEQFCQKLGETFAQLGMQILTCKNAINAECSSATARIAGLEQLKLGATSSQQKQQYQDEIDTTTTQARESIAALNNQLETSMTDAEASLSAQHEQFLAATGQTGGRGSTPDAVMTSFSGKQDAAAESFSPTDPVSDPLGGDAGLGGGSVNGAGAEQVSSLASPVNPAMMGGMPQQMPQAPAGGMPAGGGMGSQLPGQELASKAMDMAQNMGGKESTYLSDDAVKDLLAASSSESSSGGSPGESASPGSGEQSSGQSASSSGGGAVGAVPASNPTVASGPSPASPVSTPRPVGGPSVAMTELAGSPAAGGVVATGLSSAAHGVSGLTGAPASVVPAVAQPINAAATNAGGAGFGAPLAFSPNAGSVVVPSTPGPVGSAPVAAGGGSAPAQPTPAPAQPTAAPAPAPVAPPSSGASPGTVSAPVSAPPVVAGINAVPPSLGSVPKGVLELLGPPVMLAVSSAAPGRFEQLPAEQRITILNTASIVTQMREIGWPASVATALLDDGVTVAVVIATGDDLSIIPADFVIPRASILLHDFNLGEQFRSEWAGCADTVAKLVAGIDRHPWLNRSMIKHVCAFTRRSEIADPAVPFTPMSMDAAWAIKYLYTPPRETVPAHMLQRETFTEDQIRYLLGVAERHWRLPTIRLRREGQARLESASMFASRWSNSGEAVLTFSPRGYDHRVAGFLYSSTREALAAGDLERASWYAQYLRHQTLPAARGAAA
ncbi:hypothetical protein KL864_31105 [Mycolicibacterium goodii]|uniref:hypothetical protein n=1 Tax=Mycolicibacterium goodii TaxID=134601 RepID=UPI001BDD1091|nr:hypothetical protein [Mycolicibacterium goodii]MBU8820331.1 hypothetical protein [Mycolicibacterium goodii]